MSFDKVDFISLDQANAIETLTATEQEKLKQALALLGTDEEEQNVMSLLATYQKPIPWVFDDFIVDQDQVMIAGAPKTGKSWMALNLAIAAATGGQFLRWQANRCYKTLYVNLEVGEHMWARRVIQQLGGARAAYQQAFGDEPIPFYTRSDLRTIDVLDDDARREFAAYIKAKGFEFVVFDVLARCHSADENMNGEMQRVLMALRLWAPGCTTVVVHHARKPPQGSEHVNLGPASVRGASSIVGEVDLAMILGVRSGQGARYSLTFAARNVEVPDEMLLDRDEETMRYSEHEGDDSNLQAIIASAFRNTGFIPSKELHKLVADGMGVTEGSSKRYVRQAVAQGLIEPQKIGRNVQYIVPGHAPFLRVATPVQ